MSFEDRVLSAAASESMQAGERNGGMGEERAGEGNPNSWLAGLSTLQGASLGLSFLTEKWETQKASQLP